MREQGSRKFSLGSAVGPTDYGSPGMYRILGFCKVTFRSDHVKHQQLVASSNIPSTLKN